jgi:predicted ferric reductase
MCNFNLKLFYYTHWLHLPIYILTILHAHNFWIWFVIPACFLLFERVSRCVRVRSSNYGATYIRDVNLLPSKVTQLVIPRPQNFKFKAGDYVFVNIPSIANYEWHPFTISSAPELQGTWQNYKKL